MSLTRSQVLVWSQVLVSMVAFVVPTTLVAQDVQDARRPIELGIDAAVVRERSDNITATSFRLPIGRFRVGFHLTDAISLEPSVAFAYARSTIENRTTGEETSGSGTGYELDVGMLYHLRTDRSRMQPYLRPFLGVHGSSSDSDSGFETSATKLAFGGGLGFKFPMANRLGTRLELGFSHETEDDSDNGGGPSRNSFYVAFGLSFFTR